MVEAIYTGLGSLFEPSTLAIIAGGVVIGLIFGLLPGLSGIVALAILTPLIYDMQRVHALAFLLAVHAVIYSGGAVTAILLNIPGSTPNAATLIDGFPLTRKGKTDQALGAALISSMLGGCFGAFALAGLIPVVSAVVMAFGSPETFFMGVLAISFIAIISSESTLKGLIAGGVGILISFVGYQGLTGVPRFTFGALYLYSGVKLIPLALGLFALPEVLDLSAKGGTLAQVKQTQRSTWAGVLEGMKNALQHWWLVLRCSVIGAVVGIIPGVGGETAPFVAYGYAKQTSKHSDEFGSGHIEGVIAPESANNAKEGGALLPTLAFGIPGSVSMSILMGAFLIVGLTPGPAFLTEHADIAFSLIGTIILSNILACILILSLASKLAQIAFVRAHILAPIILVLITVGVFSTEAKLLDILTMLFFGVVGFAMKVHGYNRAPLLIGYVLGDILETYLYISIGAYGNTFFLRPISLTFILLTFLGLYVSHRKRDTGPKKAQTKVGGSTSGVFLPLIWLGLVLSALYVSFFYSPRAMLGPWAIGLPVVGLLLRQIWLERFPSPTEIQSGLKQVILSSPYTVASAWILALVLAIFLVGFEIALPIFTIVYLRTHQESWGLSTSLAILVSAVVQLVFAQVLAVPFYRGVFLEWT